MINAVFYDMIVGACMNLSWVSGVIKVDLYNMIVGACMFCVHVLRRQEEYIGNIVMEMEVPGKEKRKIEVGVVGQHQEQRIGLSTRELSKYPAQYRV